MSDSFALNTKVSRSCTACMPWVVCLSAGLFFLYEFFQLNLFDVINQSLRDEFNIDAAQLSWMSSAYVWANVLFLLPAGAILDRFSTRTVILIAMSICIIGTIGFALSHSYFAASIYHSLTGIGNAFCFLSCVVLVTRWFPPRRQALVIGCIVTMAFIGGMMAHTPLSFLTTHFGWRHALFIDAAVGVLIFFWIFLVVKDYPTDNYLTNQPIPKLSQPNFLVALGNPQNWLAGMYTSCLNLPIMVLCALWGASYLQEVHQLKALAASNIVSLVLIGSIIGCPLVGWLSDSWGRRKPLMIIGAVATLLTVFPLFIGISLSTVMLSLLFFILGLVTSTQVIAYPLIAESNCSENTGVATGIASVIIMGGGGVGQVLFGYLMHRHAGLVSTQYQVTDYQFAMWIFPIAALVALVCVLLTRETNCQRFIPRRTIHD